MKERFQALQAAKDILMSSPVQAHDPLDAQEPEPEPVVEHGHGYPGGKAPSWGFGYEQYPGPYPRHEPRTFSLRQRDWRGKKKAIEVVVDIHNAGAGGRNVQLTWSGGKLLMAEWPQMGRTRRKDYITQFRQKVLQYETDNRNEKWDPFGARKKIDIVGIEGDTTPQQKIRKVLTLNYEKKGSPSRQPFADFIKFITGSQPSSTFDGSLLPELDIDNEDFFSNLAGGGRKNNIKTNKRSKKKIKSKKRTKKRTKHDKTKRKKKTKHKRN